MNQLPRTTSGQILLITLLVLTVATTIALSLIGRTTTDQAINIQLEESARAFSAAEAGVEEALKSGTGGAFQLAPGVAFNVSVNSVGGASGVYQLPRQTAKGSSETFWLVNHNDDGTLNETPVFTESQVGLCWSQETVVPAIVVSVFYKEGTDGSYQVVRASFDPQAAARGNNFTSSGITANGCGLTNFYGTSLSFPSLGINLGGPSSDTLLALRVEPLYSDTTLALDTTTVLPTQGKRIDSVGSTETGVNRRVMVLQQYRVAATIFDHLIYSQSAFTK